MGFTKSLVQKRVFQKCVMGFYFLAFFCIFFVLFVFFGFGQYILNKEDKKCEILFDDASRKWLLAMTDRNEMDSRTTLYFFECKSFFFFKQRKGQAQK